MNKLTIGLASALLMGGSAVLMASENTNQATAQTSQIVETQVRGFGSALEQATSAVLPMFGQDPNAFRVSDLDNLVFANDALYQVNFSDAVDREPIASSTIKKVGYGKTEQVNVVQTRTGTYSTDGLFSPNVEYYGVDVNKRTLAEALAPLAFAWSKGGWAALPTDGSKAVHVISSDSFKTISGQ